MSPSDASSCVAVLLAGAHNNRANRESLADAEETVRDARDEDILAEVTLHDGPALGAQRTNHVGRHDAQRPRLGVLECLPTIKPETSATATLEDGCLLMPELD